MPDVDRWEQAAKALRQIVIEGERKRIAHAIREHAKLFVGDVPDVLETLAKAIEKGSYARRETKLPQEWSDNLQKEDY